MTRLAFSSSHHRVLGALSQFDPERSTLIMPPESPGSGTWTGCPGVLHEPHRFLMTYRQRRPRGDPARERGWRCAVGASDDGIQFKDVWAVEKSELNTSSMERFCLLPRMHGGYQLYLSYVDPADNRWRIDVIEADTPEAFDVQRRKPVLTAASTGTEGVKDPYLMRVGPAVYLFASFASAETLSPGRRTQAHASADIYNTGATTHPTGLAIALEGRGFEWQGSVLGVGTGWDRYQARLNSMASLPGGAWVGFYDGSAGAHENYEERCGLAISHDLRRWQRLTASAPWVLSPHGSRSLRYLDAVPVGDELWLYFEYARADGAHELRLSQIR
ncbi:MAG: hypothetical protein WBW93_08010 [Steroidobacteraceae bacterium]